MSDSGYRLADEPRPSALNHLVVNPIWPLFAVMFGGAWLSLPWFVFNGYAMGSPTRKFETACAVSAVAGCAVIAYVLVQLAEHDPAIDTTLAENFSVFTLLFTAIKLAAAYWIHILQSRTFEIYQYYGGPVRNGILVVGAGFVLRGTVLSWTEIALPFWAWIPLV